MSSIPDSKSIKIDFFGGAKIYFSGRLLPAFSTSRAHDVFCYLVLNRNKLCTREYLAELFWPERAPAQGCASLRTELWRIRKTFEQHDAPIELLFVESGRGIQLSRSVPLSIDFELFDELLTDSREKNRVENLRIATTIYKGELLSGVGDGWCIYHRELYRNRYLSALEELVNCYIGGRNWLPAIDLCILFLIEDPFAEHIHYKLMELYCQIGNRVAAIRQFESYRQRLQQGFDMAPLPETLQLFQKVVGEHSAVRRGVARKPPTLAPSDVSISRALVRIRRDIEHATNAFEFSVSQLETKK